MKYLEKKMTNEELLIKLSGILFPPLKERVTDDGTTYYVDSSVDSGLHAVYMDLICGYTDTMLNNTVKNIYNKLTDCRTLLSNFIDVNLSEKSGAVLVSGDKDEDE